jgi:hypothetical protein
LSFKHLRFPRDQQMRISTWRRFEVGFANHGRLTRAPMPPGDGLRVESLWIACDAALPTSRYRNIPTEILPEKPPAKRTNGHMTQDAGDIQGSVESTGGYVGLDRSVY